MKLQQFIKEPYTLLFALGRRGLLKWIPDKMYLKLRYKLYTGEKLHLKRPQTFNEKIQWLKLYDHNPLYSDLVDKIKAKEYIQEKYPDIKVIPTIGVWDNAEQINFDQLPEKFVLKCNHDSGSVVICQNRNTFDYNGCKKKLNRALKRNFYDLAREWAYKSVKPKILCEPYMGKMTDYKFFCFNGKPEMLYVSVDFHDHAIARISFYDFNGHEKPFHRTDYLNIGHDIELPPNFPQMLDIAGRIASGIGNSFSRIDLYSISNDIYFSEITFYPSNGMMLFEPKEADLMLGRMLKI